MNSKQHEATIPQKDEVDDLQERLIAALAAYDPLALSLAREIPAKLVRQRVGVGRMTAGSWYALSAACRDHGRRTAVDHHLLPAFAREMQERTERGIDRLLAVNRKLSQATMASGSR